MDDVLEEFISETVDNLTELDVDLVKLEQCPNDQNLLGKVFRVMHTIKGTCGFLGLSRLEKLAHASENMLDEFRSGALNPNEESMTFLFLSLDRVREIVDHIQNTGQELEGNDSDLIDAIQKIVAGGPTVGVQNQNVEDDVPITHGDVELLEEQEASLAVPTPQVLDVQSEEKPALPSSSDKGPEYLKVHMDILEDMINMVSELVLTRNQILQQTRNNHDYDGSLPVDRLNRIVSDLQDSVMKTRMQPISNAWAKFPRLVRDTSLELGKTINLRMEGEETELDRQVLELIRDPLTHMVRNSCDHGIEKPEDREKAGKPAAGTIHLKAYHEGGFIIIEIKDDGKGLNPQVIGAKAVEKGLLDADKLSTFSDKELLSFIMKPGFSTAEAITTVSGRGVGMDVVRENIEKIGGAIDMDSVVGKGTKFTIQIPLTLAIISGLIVEINKQRYAVPQMNIQELVSLNQANQKDIIEYIDEKPVLRLRNRIIPLLDSAQLLNLNEDQQSLKDRGKLIVVMSSGATFYGIIVDKIYDTEEVVIKSISSVLSSTRIFSGNTILGDGQVVMILDPGAIAREFNLDRDMSQDQLLDKQEQDQIKFAQQKIPVLLFKAGEGIPKAIPLELVSRLQVFESKDIAASDDKIVVPLNEDLIQLVYVDPKSQNYKSRDKVEVLLLSDDRSDSIFGLIIDKIIDITESELSLNQSTSKPGILGSTMINGKPHDVVEVTHFMEQDKSDWFSMQTHQQKPFLDPDMQNSSESMYSEVASSPVNENTKKLGANDYAPSFNESDKQLRVLVVDDSSFFRNMLRPLLSAAGYNVTVSESAVHALELHDKGHMFDVVLSDIEMPEMNGFEFIEKIRADSKWHETPVIALTSHYTPDDIKYGYVKGFNEYIGKFNKKELLDTIVSATS